MKKNSPTGKIGIEDAYEVMEEIKKKAKQSDKSKFPEKKNLPMEKAGEDVPGRK